jgi:hypothetical protein
MDWIEVGELAANPPWTDDTRTDSYSAGSLATAENGCIWLEAAVEEKVAHVDEIHEQQNRRLARRAMSVDDKKEEAASKRAFNREVPTLTPLHSANLECINNSERNFKQRANFSKGNGFVLGLEHDLILDYTVDWIFSTQHSKTIVESGSTHGVCCTIRVRTHMRGSDNLWHRQQRTVGPRRLCREDIQRSTCESLST